MKSQAVGFDKQYWESVWRDVSLPQLRTPEKYHELHRIFSTYLPTTRQSLFEVGCAPGSWLAYFARTFDYDVTGVEYAEDAYAKTLENMQLLEIAASIHLGDFFTFDGGPYDIIFSSGFIEHFADVDPVIERLAALCRPGGYVVTIIPSLGGLNWWISQRFRPEVAAGHYPITGNQLRSMHEQQDLQTLWNAPYGCFKVRPPFDNTLLARQSPQRARLLNLPIKAWNQLIGELSRRTGYYPKSAQVFMGHVYIGQKPIEA